MFLEAEVSGVGTFIQLLMPFVIMLAVMYFFLIRPQQAQQKERQAMIDGLAKGDKIVSIGGIHGEITAISDDHIKLKIADGTVISLSKSGVGSVIS